MQEVSNTDKHRIPIGIIPRQTAFSFPASLLSYVDDNPLTGIRKHDEIIFRVRRRPDESPIEGHELRPFFDLGLETPKALKHTSGIVAMFNGIHMAINEQLLLKAKRFFP